MKRQITLSVIDRFLRFKKVKFTICTSCYSDAEYDLDNGGYGELPHGIELGKDRFIYCDCGRAEVLRKLKENKDVGC